MADRWLIFFVHLLFVVVVVEFVDLQFAVSIEHCIHQFYLEIVWQLNVRPPRYIHCRQDRPICRNNHRYSLVHDSSREQRYVRRVDNLQELCRLILVDIRTIRFRPCLNFLDAINVFVRVV